MNAKQKMGIAGSILLFVGCFLPIIGNLTSFRNGYGMAEATVVIALAIASLVLTLKANYRWLWLTGLSSTAIVGYRFLGNLSDMMLLTSAIDTLRAAGRQPDVDLPAYFGVGWAVLLLGAGLIIAAAAVKEKPSE